MAIGSIDALGCDGSLHTTRVNPPVSGPVSFGPQHESQTGHLAAATKGTHVTLFVATEVGPEGHGIQEGFTFANPVTEPAVCGV